MKLVRKETLKILSKEWEHPLELEVLWSAEEVLDRILRDYHHKEGARLEL